MLLGSVGCLCSAKGQFYPLYWILKNVQGENCDPVAEAGFWSSRLMRMGQHCRVRGTQGLWGFRVQKKMLKGERNYKHLGGNGLKWNYYLIMGQQANKKVLQGRSVAEQQEPL